MNRRRLAAKEHISRLVQVHAVDWRAMGLDRVLTAPTAPADAAGVLVDLLEQLRRFRGAPGLPAAEAAASFAGSCAA
ncbi:hypothetical protein [Rhodococcus jostii]|uniref:hypothetical protein n=1 Tax=Rhodococcus jostii TaxID=132919 RepID=UPI0036562940